MIDCESKSYKCNNNNTNHEFVFFFCKCIAITVQDLKTVIICEQEPLHLLPNPN